MIMVISMRVRIVVVVMTMGSASLIEATSVILKSSYKLFALGGFHSLVECIATHLLPFTFLPADQNSIKVGNLPQIRVHSFPILEY